MFSSEKVKKNLSSKCFELRKIKGASQTRIADLVDIDWSHYAHIERGDSLPSVTLLLNLADVLDFSIDELMEEPDSHTQNDEKRKMAKRMIDKLSPRDLDLLFSLLEKMLEQKP